MLRRGDESARDRIVVQIGELLLHHLVAHQRLRVIALLPELQVGFGLVSGAPLPQEMQQPVALFGPELRGERASGVTLEIGNDSREIGRGDDGMEVIVEDDPGVNLQPFVDAAVFERVRDDLAAGIGGEDGQPPDDGGGDELRGMRLRD